MKEQEAILSSRRRQIQIIGVVLLILGFFICSIYLELSMTAASINHDTNFPGTKVTRLDMCDKHINVVIQFLHGSNSTKLQRYVRNFLTSLLSRTNCRLHLYIVVDDEGIDCLTAIFDQLSLQYAFKLPTIEYLNSVGMPEKTETLMRAVNTLFVNKGNSYFNRWFFFTSLMLHRLLPVNITKVIMLDIDMEFRGDIQELYSYFDLMNTSNIIGLAREQQPVYAHVNSVYRKNHVETLIGAPPPNGLTGFNSGTLLIDLKAMRNSTVYNKFIDDIRSLKELIDRYHFNGHLGDQDFYTLLSFEYMDLFYTLPCQWNRQLCQWWKNDGYKSVFDSYFNCTPPYYILHGNCDSPIPDPTA